MAKKQRLQMDEERKEQVVDEFVGLYIRAGGRMPSSRMIKKNSYITEKEIDSLRRSGELSESRVRRLAEQRTGQKVAEATGMKLVLKRKNAEMEPVLEQKVAEMVEMKPEVRKMKSRGRKGVTKEEVQEDLSVLTKRLRHVPTQRDIRDVENGAKYSFSTYVKYLGPTSGWAVLLGFEKSKAEDAQVEVEEPETNELEVEAVQVPRADERTTGKVIEVPLKIVVKVILPQEDGGKVTVKIVPE